MIINILASGSKGNSTLLLFDNTLIVIDLGITKKCLIAGLKEINCALSDISGVLLTHEHSDHIKGIKFVSPNLVYTTTGTLNTSFTNHIEYLTPFYINEVKITPIPTSHDARMPCGFMLEYNSEKVVYITDTGTLDKSLLQLLNNPSVIILESNHDISMELKSHRPLLSKQRILSDYGHLSNEDSAFIAASIIGERTRDIVLAHISEECNTPEVALQAYREVFAYKGLDINNYNVMCAPQWESLIIK